VNNKQLNAELEATLILNLNDSLKAIDEWQLTLLLETLDLLDDASFNTLVEILSNGKGDVQIAIRRAVLLDLLSSAKAKIQELNKKFKEVQKQASEFMKALNKALTPSQELLLLQLVNSGNIEAFHQAFIKYKQQLESRMNWCRSCSEKLLKVTTQADMNTLKKIIEGSKAGLCAADSALNLKIRKPLEQIVNIISSDYIFALFFAGYLADQGQSLAAFSSVASFLQFATGAQLFFTNFERWLNVYSNNPFVRVLRDIYHSADAASLSLNLSWDIGLNISNAVSAYMTQLNKFLTDPGSLSTEEAINLICETAATLWDVGTTVTYRPPVTTEKQRQNAQQQSQTESNQSVDVSSGTQQETTTPRQGITTSDHPTSNLPPEKTIFLKTDTVTDEHSATSEDLAEKITKDKLQIFKGKALGYSFFVPWKVKPIPGEWELTAESENVPKTTEEKIETEAAGVFEWDGGEVPRVAPIPLLQQAGNYSTVRYKFRYLYQGKAEDNPDSFIVHSPDIPGIARIEKSDEPEWLVLVISNDKLYSTDTVSLLLRHSNDNANLVMITVQPYPAQITFTADIKYTPLVKNAKLLIDASYTTIDQSGGSTNNKLPGMVVKVKIPELGISDLTVKTGEPAEIPSTGLNNQAQITMQVDYSTVRDLLKMPEDVPTTVDITATITKVGPNEVNKIRVEQALKMPDLSSQSTPMLLRLAISPSRQFVAYAVGYYSVQYQPGVELTELDDDLQPATSEMRWQTDIVVTSLLTGDSVILKSPVPEVVSTDFVWHPIKDFVILKRTLFDTIEQIVAYKAGEVKPRILVEYTGKQPGEIALRNLSISADGSKLAWSTANALHVAPLYADDNDISIDLENAIHHPVGSPEENALAHSIMQLSPDGNEIVYTYNNMLVQFEPSTKATLAVANNVNPVYISWSPDSRYIAFVNLTASDENWYRYIELVDTNLLVRISLPYLRLPSTGQTWLSWLSDKELVYEPDPATLSSMSASPGDLACCDLSNASQPSVRAIRVIRDQVASVLQSAEVRAKYAEFYLVQTNDSYELKAVMEVATNVIGIGQAAEQ
jgi:hypothetical protein